ncbi:MAG: hypothetical protein RL272_468 [Candidatus Parcubacteria bacterium]|jgi:hypothetical protein
MSEYGSMFDFVPSDALCRALAEHCTRDHAVGRRIASGLRVLWRLHGHPSMETLRSRVRERILAAFVTEAYRWADSEESAPLRVTRGERFSDDFADTLTEHFGACPECGPEIVSDMALEFRHWILRRGGIIRMPGGRPFSELCVGFEGDVWMKVEPAADIDPA